MATDTARPFLRPWRASLGTSGLASVRPGRPSQVSTPPPTEQTCQFMHWMMGLHPWLPDALGLSVSAQRRLAGNAVVGLQARLMLQRGLTATEGAR